MSPPTTRWPGRLALLDDVLEDSGVGAEELSAEGIPAEVIELSSC